MPSCDELHPEEKNRTTLRKKQLPMREGLDDESFFTIWVETSDIRTQEEVAVEAFRKAIDAVKKVDQTATFRCIYEGDGGRRLNGETGKMEPYPDITCAADVPEDIAGLRKYFEPNFEAMLVDQKGDDDDGNPREEWNITGTGLGKTSVESDSCTTKPTGTLVAKACERVTKRSKN